jgi:hypothetical protein
MVRPLHLKSGNLKEGPGPAAYRVSSVPKIRGGKFGQFRRKPIYREEATKVPGPGQYKTMKPTRKLLGKIGRQPRNKRTVIEDYKVKNEPGPGQYDPRSVRMGPYVSFDHLKPRFQRGEEEETPGPQTYRVPYRQIFDKSQKATMRVRREPLNDNMENPGPDEYDVKQAFDFVRARNNQYQYFSTQKRPDIASNGDPSVPGPLKYKLPSTFHRHSKNYYDQKMAKINKGLALRNRIRKELESQMETQQTDEEQQEQGSMSAGSDESDFE